MLTIATSGSSRTCDGLDRRDFLRIGGLAVGGVSLPHLLASRATAGEPHWARDKSIVMLYLSGGASHIETFDPHMDSPSGTRSVTGEVKTKLPGVTFGGTFPRLASRADQLAVVRSFQHPIGGHEQAHVHVLTGGTDPKGDTSTGFSIGSCFTRLRGTNHPATGMPTYSLLTEQESDGQYSKELGRVRKGSHAGELGPSYGAFEHQTNAFAKASSSKRRKNENPLAENMRLNIEAERFADRKHLLRQLDRFKRAAQSDSGVHGVDQFNEQAVNLMLGGAADAFDFARESPALLEKYDTSGMMIGHKTFRRSTLGHQMLVARRLCEAGTGFVTVHSAGWDMHADGNNPGMVKGMHMLGVTLDKAVSAFLDDVRERGLSDKVLLVITGDFGRTPKVNSKGGRDHWARLGTLAFAGGGLPMGQVIGQSERDAGTPASEPINAGHLMSTIMHTAFDIGELRLDSSVPRELNQLVTESPPIKELFV